MGKYTTYVGMDVHARSIDASAVNVETGESFRKVFAGNPAAAEVAAWLHGLPQPAYSAYESGCTGFRLARDLRELGCDCDVIAVSSIAKSAKDRQGKCDKLDARAIRREIANPDRSCSAVWVPDKRTEGQRELMRMRASAAGDLKRAKQRLSALLLRHGFVWDGKTPTGRPRKAAGRAYREWLDKIDLGEASSNAALAAARRQIAAAEQELDQLDEEVARLAEAPENKPYVDAFMQLKGVDLNTAMVARVEFGDFSRFTAGRQVSSWLGTIPKDSSSGPRESHGGITKAGNKYLRKSLVEGLTGIDSWKSARKAPPKGRSVSGACADAAMHANERIWSRYRHLHSERGKRHNVAKVAVVSELVRWIWAIGVQVQREQEATCA